MFDAFENIIETPAFLQQIRMNSPSPLRNALINRESSKKEAVALENSQS